jgi:hypothetical protein
MQFLTQQGTCAHLRCEAVVGRSGGVNVLRHPHYSAQKWLRCLVQLGADEFPWNKQMSKRRDCHNAV